MKSLLEEREISEIVRAVSDAAKDAIQSVESRVTVLETKLAEREERIRQLEARPTREKIIEEIVPLFHDTLKGWPISAIVRAAVQDAVEELPRGRDGIDGAPGKDAEVNRDTLTLMVREEVQRAVSGIPTPKDGAAGKDADLALVREIAAIEAEKAVRGIKPDDASPVRMELPPAAETVEMLLPALKDRLREHIAEMVRLIEIPKGDPGPAGRDAAPVDMNAVDGMIKRHVDALPKPKDGLPGKDGNPGADGRTPTREEIVEIAESALSARSSAWALDFERRANDTLQRALERFQQPKDGTPGRDALDLEDFDMKHDGDGLVTFTFKRGSVEKRFDVRLPRFKYHGVFQEGRAYREGDAVTHGGSLFIARKDSPSGKPAAEGDWQLAVKQGGQGRMGEPGRPGKDGKDGLNGRDLRYT